MAGAVPLSVVVLVDVGKGQREPAPQFVVRVLARAVRNAGSALTQRAARDIAPRHGLMRGNCSVLLGYAPVRFHTRQPLGVGDLRRIADPQRADGRMSLPSPSDDVLITDTG